MPYYIYVFCVGACGCACTLWRSEGILQVLILCFHHVGSGIELRLSVLAATPPPLLPAELTGSRTVIHSLIVQEVLTDHFLGMMKVQNSVLTLSGVTDLWSADDLVTLKWQGHVIMRDSVLHHILILATSFRPWATD